MPVSVQGSASRWSGGGGGVRLGGELGEADKEEEIDDTNETSETLESQAQPSEDEKGERERRRPRWLCSLFMRKEPREGGGKMKKLWHVSIMGRIGAFFKKDKDKASASNPYAQQPVEQQTPPPQYTQHNAQQFSDNQSISSQGPPYGLPAGPRPGGLPSRVAPPPPRQETFDSGIAGIEKSPPPQYAPLGAQPSSHGSGSPSFYSAGGTPVLGSNSNTSSPSVGGGFPREKFGASDGFGRGRFESPSQSPYQNSAQFSSQRQPGYGNLDSGNELFDGYNPQSRLATRPSPTQTDEPYGSSTQYGESQPMTEEEREEAHITDLREQIVVEGAAANAVGNRNADRLDEANARMRAMNAQLLQNQNMLDRAQQNMRIANREAEVNSVNLDDLDAANKPMLNLVANSKKNIARRNEKKLGIQERYRVEEDLEEKNELERKLEAEMRAFEAAEPKGLLGASTKKTDHSRFEFEDDDGRQRENNEEYDRIIKRLEIGTRELHLNAHMQSVALDHQNSQLNDMTEQVMIAGDRVARNKFRLDTAKYNKS